MQKLLFQLWPRDMLPLSIMMVKSFDTGLQVISMEQQFLSPQVRIP